MHVERSKNALGCSRMPVWQTRFCCVTFGPCLASLNLLQAFFVPLPSFFFYIPPVSHLAYMHKNRRQMTACMISCMLSCTWLRCDSGDVISNAGLILLC